MNLFRVALCLSVLLPSLSKADQVTYECKQAYGRADSNFNIKADTLRRVADVVVVREGHQFLYGMEDGIDSPELHDNATPGFFSNVVGNVQFAMVVEGSNISFFMADRGQKVGVQAYDCTPKKQ
ncbi:hypothetical protein [Pantoea septica]|uniref:hypothetical protein n=1 Tax=Pantoea septica TaxID=472695 RepID=UPI0023F6EBDF|nr:hypothetical protein [Pantoea septica]